MSRARRDSLEYRCVAKESEDNMEAFNSPMQSNRREVCVAELAFTRNAESIGIDLGEAPVLAVCHVPRECSEVREVGKAVAECREFPIEHGNYTWLGGMEHDVADAEVAMHNHSGAACRRDVRVEPELQCFDGIAFGDGRKMPLPVPACDLALEVAIRAAKVREAGRLYINCVELGKRPGGGAVHCAAFRGSDPGERRVVKDPALDEIHDVESRSDNVRLLVQKKHAGNRDARVSKRVLYTKLAIDGMC